MKHFVKSNSTLNDYDFSKRNNYINNSFKLFNDSPNIKNKKKFIINLNFNKKTFNFSNKKNNNNETMNINLLKKPISKNLLILRKTRNKIRKDIFKNKSNIDIFEKFKPNTIEKENTKNKPDDYLLLTSLYNLPKIKITKQPNKNIYFNTHLSDTSKNSFYTGLNNSKINDRNIFDESFTSSNRKLNFNYMNLLYNNNIPTNKVKSTFKKKKRVLSTLDSLLNHKYYSDTEKVLKEKITEESFPADSSLRDKVIHMKKVGAFWDSVFKYCVPIINVRKYKVRKDIFDRKRKDYLKLIKSKSKSIHKINNHTNDKNSFTKYKQ